MITFVYYYGTLNNFFYGDDFIWLERVRHLSGNWMHIFTIENRYFTPLTYLSFFVNYKLAGLHAFWYHLLDVIFHSLNGLLLYALTYQVSKNRLTAFLAAIAFVTSFSIIITVVWPSARTDLMMVTFSLATIIAFIRKDSNRFQYVLPMALYIVALSAKGTALVIPLILFLLTSDTKPLGSRLRKILPYLAINGAYVALLILSSFRSTANGIPTHNAVSVSNFVKSLPTLVIPERLLAQTDISVLVIISVIVLIILCAINMKLKDSTLRIGTALTVTGLLPLLFTHEYSLAGNNAGALNFIGSPSNRVYLACAGISLVFAVIAEKALNNNRHASLRIASVIVLTSLLHVNYHEAGLKNKIWSAGTTNARYSMFLLDKYSAMLTEGSVLLLFNFEGSSGFVNGMINSAYDVNKIEVHSIFYRNIDKIIDVDLSPLKNPAYAYNAATVKLILNCSGAPYEQFLTQYGNLTLKDIFSDYRLLFEAKTAAEEIPIRERLNNSMLKFKGVLDKCELAGGLI
jgi:hypothetical protein